MPRHPVEMWRFHRPSLKSETITALLWAMSYRANPVQDIQIVNYRARGHGPVLKDAENESSMLIDAP